MARIIVWAKRDNDNADKLIDARKFKRGMVVDILEDGQSAGKDVEAGAWWRVVEAPGPASDYAYLLQADPAFANDKLFQAEAQYPRKRQVKLDLDTLEATAAVKSPADTIALRKADVVAQPVAKVDNPVVIGGVDTIG